MGYSVAPCALWPVGKKVSGQTCGAKCATSHAHYGVGDKGSSLERGRGSRVKTRDEARLTEGVEGEGGAMLPRSILNNTRRGGARSKTLGPHAAGSGCSAASKRPHCALSRDKDWNCGRGGRGS